MVGLDEPHKHAGGLLLGLGREILLKAEQRLQVHLSHISILSKTVRLFVRTSLNSHQLNSKHPSDEFHFPC